MLASLLKFKGRLGRLRYFLTCLALGPVLVVAFVALMLVFGLHPGAGRAVNFKALGLAGVVVVPLWFWTSLSLQACRIRDIGWSPLWTILGVFGLGLIDRVLAMSVPALSIGHLHQITVLGVAVNLSFAGVLLFWPGGAGPVDGADADWTAEPPAPSPPRAAAFGAPAAVSGFGRRGL